MEHSTHTIDPGVGVKPFLLLKVDMLQIKLMGMEHKAPCKCIFRTNTQPQLPRLGQTFCLSTEGYKFDKSDFCYVRQHIRFSEF